MYLPQHSFQNRVSQVYYERNGAISSLSPPGLRIQFPRNITRSTEVLDSKISRYGSSASSEGKGRTAKSADLPGVKLPVSFSQPRLSAPDNVIMRSKVSPGIVGYWRW